jgi:hypothetical protein
MDITELASPSADSFKFQAVGDKAVGTITYIGQWQERTNKFNGRIEQVTKIVIDADGDELAIWPVKGSRMAQAIGEAAMAAGAKTLEVGGKLAVAYASDRDTGKPQPMKWFEAKYEPPVGAAAPVDASDLF